MIAAIAETELPEGGTKALVFGGWPVLVSRDAGEVHAVIDRCTHQAATLSGGRIRRGIVMCPLHGARFEMSSGRCLGGGYPALTTFPASIADGIVRIELPDTPPGEAFSPAGT